MLCDILEIIIKLQNEQKPNAKKYIYNQLRQALVTVQSMAPKNTSPWIIKE